MVVGRSGTRKVAKAHSKANLVRKSEPFYQIIDTNKFQRLLLEI